MASAVPSAAATCARVLWPGVTRCAASVTVRPGCPGNCGATGAPAITAQPASNAAPSDALATRLARPIAVLHEVELHQRVVGPALVMQRQEVGAVQEQLAIAGAQLGGQVAL